jgi:hypothetical protein
MRLSPLPLFAVAVAVVGCRLSNPDPQVEVTLDEFRSLAISATAQSLEITLDDGDLLDRWTPCPVLGAGTTARLGGLVVPLIEPGGKIGTSPGDDVDDNVCAAPRFLLDQPPPDGAALLTLSDSSTAVLCHIPDLKAERQVTPVSPSTTWEWRAGQAVVLQWSPSGDLGMSNRLSVDLLHRDATNQIDSDVTVGQTHHDDVVSFTVPALAPGSYALALHLSPTVLCSPARSTYLRSTPATFDVEHAVTIVP